MIVLCSLFVWQLFLIFTNMYMAYSFSPSMVICCIIVVTLANLSVCSKLGKCQDLHVWLWDFHPQPPATESPSPHPWLAGSAEELTVPGNRPQPRLLGIRVSIQQPTSGTILTYIMPFFTLFLWDSFIPSLAKCTLSPSK